MEIINTLSITNLENLVVATEVNQTRIKVNFDVSFNHEGSENPSEIYHSLYGYKVEIMGYPEPRAIDRSAESVFHFERTVYRWIPDQNQFGGSGFWGNGRMIRTVTEIFDLSGTPNQSGPLEVNLIGYENQEVLSQIIEMDLLDVNPATVNLELPLAFGGGTHIAREEDQIFARVRIVDKATSEVVGQEDSNTLRGFFGRGE